MINLYYMYHVYDNSIIISKGIAHYPAGSPVHKALYQCIQLLQYTQCTHIAVYIVHSTITIIVGEHMPPDSTQCILGEHNNGAFGWLARVVSIMLQLVQCKGHLMSQKVQLNLKGSHCMAYCQEHSLIARCVASSQHTFTSTCTSTYTIFESGAHACHYIAVITIVIIFIMLTVVLGHLTQYVSAKSKTDVYIGVDVCNLRLQSTYYISCSL